MGTLRKDSKEPSFMFKIQKSFQPGNDQEKGSSGENNISGRKTSKCKHPKVGSLSTSTHRSEGAREDMVRGGARGGKSGLLQGERHTPVP